MESCEKNKPLFNFEVQKNEKFLIIPHLFNTLRQDNAYAQYRIIYRQVSNTRRTLVGNKIVDHSDVVGASPVGAAPTTSSFST